MCEIIDPYASRSALAECVAAIKTRNDKEKIEVVREK